MKKQHRFKTLFIGLLVLNWLAILPQFGEDLKDQPDSIRYMMGITVDDSTLEELPGANVSDFRVYMTEQNSAITWKYENNYYVYTLSEDGHRLTALKLFEQLRANGLSTFIARRQGNKIRFNEYRKVIALQIAAQKN